MVKIKKEKKVMINFTVAPVQMDDETRNIAKEVEILKEDILREIKTYGRKTCCRIKKSYFTF